jgi:hypothetical protein
MAVALARHSARAAPRSAYPLRVQRHPLPCPGGAGPGRGAGLVPVDTATGAAGPAVLLPGEALGGLGDTAERVYVPDAFGHGVWVVDHRRGRRLETVPAGTGPVAIALSPPP